MSTPAIHTFVPTSPRSQRLTGWDDCRAVCSIFQNLGCELDERDVAMSEELRNELRERLPERATTHAVPRVFIGDHYLGGYDEVTELNETGQLLRLLKVRNAVALPPWPGPLTSVEKLMGQGRVCAAMVRRWGCRARRFACSTSLRVWFEWHWKRPGEFMPMSTDFEPPPPWYTHSDARV